MDPTENPFPAGDADRRAIWEMLVPRDIDGFLAGDRAVARKKFDGAIARADGGVERLNWQTLYFCRRARGRWRIAGFVGYLPHPMGGARR
jgi:hypothetical protein